MEIRTITGMLCDYIGACSCVGTYLVAFVRGHVISIIETVVHDVCVNPCSWPLALRIESLLLTSIVQTLTGDERAECDIDANVTSVLYQNANN